VTIDAVAVARRAVLDAAADVGRPVEGVGEAPAVVDDWSLNPRALDFLTHLVARLQPRAVFELGSGTSTVTLATAASALPNPASIVTIESDPFHHARTTEMLHQANLCGAVRLVDAHLVARRRHGRYVPTYAAPVPGGDGNEDVWRAGWADVVLVDGPPLPLGGREGSIDQALAAARVGGVVVLDDSRRDSERELLARMLTQFDGSVEAMNLLGFDKGLAVVLVTAPISADER